MENLRYPLGRYNHPSVVDEAQVDLWISQIEALPDELRDAITGLTDDQLDTRYRPGGWKLRQVVHHVPDSHLNSYVRFKLALTENVPIIKPYDEAAWARLPDTFLVSVESNLELLASLHAKWVVLLRSLSVEQLSRKFVHPESGAVDLAWNVGYYAWHGRHHLAHITSTIEREGWRNRT